MHSLHRPKEEFVSACLVDIEYELQNVGLDTSNSTILKSLEKDFSSSVNKLYKEIEMIVDTLNGATFSVGEMAVNTPSTILEKYPYYSDYTNLYHLSFDGNVFSSFIETSFSLLMNEIEINMQNNKDDEKRQKYGQLALKAIKEAKDKFKANYMIPLAEELKYVKFIKATSQVVISLYQEIAEIGANHKGKEDELSPDDEAYLRYFKLSNKGESASMQEIFIELDNIGRFIEDSGSSVDNLAKKYKSLYL